MVMEIFTHHLFKRYNKKANLIYKGFISADVCLHFLKVLTYRGQDCKKCIGCFCVELLLQYPRVPQNMFFLQVCLLCIHAAEKKSQFIAIINFD